MMIANVFHIMEMELFETGRDDVTIICDALVGHPKESKGVRVKVLRS